MRIKGFGTVSFTPSIVDEPVGSDGALQGAFSLSGKAAWDSQRSEDSPSGLTPIRRTITAAASSATALQTALDLVRAKTRQKDKLYVEMDDGSIRWRNARLTKLATKPVASELGPYAQEVAMEWTPTDADWYGHHHGGGWTLDSGIYFDTGYYFDEHDKYTLTGEADHQSITHGTVTGTYSVGETVKGMTSLATGRLVAKGSGYLYLDNVSGTFQASETLKGLTSNATATSSAVARPWYQAVKWTGASLAFVVGNVVTGGTSGATGVVRFVGSGFILMDTCVGLFQSGENLVVGGTPYVAASAAPFAWQKITLANEGNASVDDVTITVAVPGSVADITDLYLAILDTIEERFTGTIADGTSLVVDTGAQSVLNDGANAYDDFQPTAYHKEDPWLLLAPGNTDVYVAWVGGGITTTITFDYWARWR
jgi:hypothetical protein